MPKFLVNVKWGKTPFRDVELDTDEPPLLFKAQLFALTGVQPDRQKVVIKGVTIKDNEWGNIQLKNGVPVLLMGSREELPETPVEKVVFQEDMTESELANALELPPGLVNLGNTCYLNATLQCLKTVPELREALKKYKGEINYDRDVSVTITAAMRELFDTMDRGSVAVAPLVLLQALHVALPHFAEKSQQGGYCQQDANECWTEIVRMLQQKLPVSKLENGETQAHAFTSIIDQYFGGRFEVEYKCLDSELEDPTKATENFCQLSCFISQDVRYMMSGIKSKLQEKITKYSHILQRDADYLKTCKVTRLPAYLSIQFVRFYYKGKANINAKILKDVKFPLDFDAYELCAEELQQKLTPMRAKFKNLEDASVDKVPDRPKTTKNDKNSKKPTSNAYEKYSFDDDIGSNNSGYYTLQAVLTHQGRSSSSGHFIGWVRQTHNSDVWMKCDDTEVTAVTSEEVLRLSGGGDWHCAYVLLYGPRKLEQSKDTNVKITEITGMETEDKST